MNFSEIFFFALLLNIIDRIFPFIFWKSVKSILYKNEYFSHYRNQYTNNSFIGEYFEHYLQTKKKKHIKSLQN